MARQSLLSRIIIPALGLTEILFTLLIPGKVFAQSETTPTVTGEAASGQVFTVVGIIASILILAMILYLVFSRQFSNPAKNVSEKSRWDRAIDPSQSSFRNRNEPEIEDPVDSPKNYLPSGKELSPATSEELPSPRPSVAAETGLNVVPSKGIGYPPDLPEEVVHESSVEIAPGQPPVISVGPAIEGILVHISTPDTPDVIVGYSFSIFTHDGTGGPIDSQNRQVALLVVNLTIENLKSEMFRFYPRINTRLVIDGVTYSPIFNEGLERIFWGEIDVPAGAKSAGQVAFAIPGTAIGHRPELEFITSQPYNIKLFQTDSQNSL